MVVGGLRDTVREERGSEEIQRRVAGELADVCGHLNVLHERMVSLTREVVESGAWGSSGCRSVEQWLAWQTGLSPERARQVVMLANRQTELPVSFAAFAQGLLSVDQIAVVARRVPVHNDAQASELAQAATVSQLRVGLSKHFLTFPEQPDEPDGPDPDPALRRPDPKPVPVPVPEHRLVTGFDDDGNFFLRGLADAVDGALIERALAEAKDKLFHSGQPDVTWLDALIEVCRRSLSMVGSVSRRDLFKVIVHLDQQGAWVHHGPPIPANLLEHLTCDGTIRPLWSSAGFPINMGRAQHTVPSRTRIVVEDRDRGCRHPACTTTTNLQVHHLIHWINGGPTDTCNLACLCPAHHRAHHRGVFSVDGDADQPNGLIFRDRDGQVLAGCGTPHPPGDRPPPPPPSPYIHPTGEHLELRWLHFPPPPPPAQSGERRPPANNN